MKKYKIIKTIEEHLSYDDAWSILTNLEDVGELKLEIQEYEFIPPEFRKMGRDPDIH
tara:strand:+ start:87 stop:257 length:171 start_codon:yes stop_codon:yes gene_type:complete